MIFILSNIINFMETIVYKSFKYSKFYLSAILFSFITSLQAAKFSHYELIYMPASKQIELFKDGNLSPVDIVKAQIQELKKTNKSTGIASEVFESDSLNKALESEKRYKNGSNRPLEGLTIAVRDDVLSENSKYFSKKLIKMLENSGAIILLKTSVPKDLSFKTPNIKILWNNKFSIGSLSSGSAAAIASGYVTLAAGTVQNGSERVPASLSGIYSFKPAFVKKDGKSDELIIDIIGPMAKTFYDMILLNNNIKHHTKIAFSEFIKDDDKKLKGMKIAYLGGMGIIKPSQEVQESMAKSIKGLRELGAEVEVLDIDFGISSEELKDVYYNFWLPNTIGSEILNNKNLTKDQQKIIDNNKLEIKNYAKKISQKIYYVLNQEAFSKGYNVLMVPTLPTSEFPSNFNFATNSVNIDGVKYPYMVEALYTLPFNMTNSLPVITVPAFLSKNQIPIGFQLIGKPFTDKDIFKATYYFSKNNDNKLYQEKLPLN